jgi:50S ribosomal subunit-associated GTPase HflX
MEQQGLTLINLMVNLFYMNKPQTDATLSPTIRKSKLAFVLMVLVW